MASAEQQRAFLSSYNDYAKGVSYQTGIPSDFILGQWALETGWGTSFAGKYNVGNIQGAAARPYNYTSQQAGVQAYGNTLSNMRYSAARTAETPEAFGQALKNAGYATDPSYASKIADTIKNVVSLRGGESDTAGNGGSMWDKFNPLTYIKSKGLDVVFLVVGGGLIIFSLINATKGNGENG